MCTAEIVIGMACKLTCRQQTSTRAASHRKALSHLCLVQYQRQYPLYEARKHIYVCNIIAKKVFDQNSHLYPTVTCTHIAGYETRDTPALRQEAHKRLLKFKPTQERKVYRTCKILKQRKICSEKPRLVCYLSRRCKRRAAVGNSFIHLACLGKGAQPHRSCTRPLGT